MSLKYLSSTKNGPNPLSLGAHLTSPTTNISEKSRFSATITFRFDAQSESDHKLIQIQRGSPPLWATAPRDHNPLHLRGHRAPCLKTASSDSLLPTPRWDPDGKIAQVGHSPDKSSHTKDERFNPSPWGLVSIRQLRRAYAAMIWTF